MYLLDLQNTEKGCILHLGKRIGYAQDDLKNSAKRELHNLLFCSLLEEIHYNGTWRTRPKFSMNATSGSIVSKWSGWFKEILYGVFYAFSPLVA